MPTAKRLAVVRRQRSYSQRELSRLAGINRVTLRHLENGGSALPRTIRRLAEVLGVEPQELDEPT